MKNRDYLRWQPAFHWTDQKIRVHSLYCVMALLLVSLARRMAHEAGLEFSSSAFLDEISGIKEVALFYQGNKHKPRLTLSSMTPCQKKLAEVFQLSNFFVGG